jgi:hypothetical protein
MPRRIVVNCCFGGFCLSDEAKQMYKTLTAATPRSANWYADQDIARDDPILLAIIDSIGLKRAAGQFSKLTIVEIPDDFPEDGWTINEYDGQEWVAEKHRRWFPTPSLDE